MSLWFCDTCQSVQPDGDYHCVICRRPLVLATLELPRNVDAVARVVDASTERPRAPNDLDSALSGGVGVGRAVPPVVILEQQYRERAYNACREFEGSSQMAGTCLRCGCNGWAHAWRLAADGISDALRVVVLPAATFDWVPQEGTAVSFASPVPPVEPLEKDYEEARAQALSGWPIDERENLDIQCDDGRLVYVGLAKDAPLWALVASLSLTIAELTRPSPSPVVPPVDSAPPQPASAPEGSDRWRVQFEARAALFDTFLDALGSRNPTIAMARLEQLIAGNTQFEHIKALADAGEMLWVVLANVSGGDWTKQSVDWQEAAARWRDNYHAVLRACPDVDSAVDPVVQTQHSTSTRDKSLSDSELAALRAVRAPQEPKL